MCSSVEYIIDVKGTSDVVLEGDKVAEPLLDELAADSEFVVDEPEIELEDVAAILRPVRADIDVDFEEDIEDVDLDLVEELDELKSELCDSSTPSIL